MLTIKILIEQDEQDGFTGMEKLRDKLSKVLRNIQKEKEEEKLIVDIWCHFGHTYITNVDEGEWRICCFCDYCSHYNRGDRIC